MIAALLTSCEDTTFRSSVPNAAVRVVINTDLGAFVHFQPTAMSDYITVDGEGFHYHDQLVYPLGTNMYGYGGVLVYVSMNGYDAYDLACPYCASRGLLQPCEVKDLHAVCPHCGEEYDLASGTAAPCKGLINETLRRYKVTQAGHTLTITQQ